MLSDLEIMWFFRQLQYLLNSGISLYPSITIIYNDAEDTKIKKIIKEIVLQLREGDSFSHILHTKIKTGVFITNIIKVGEHKGTLDHALNKAIEYLQRKIELKRKLLNAFSYPVLLTLLSIGILLWVNIQIIPNFQEVYSQAGVILPLPTRILFFTHQFFTDNWLRFVVVVFGLLFVSYFILRKDLKMYFAKAQYMLPVFGNVYYYLSMLLFLSDFGTLQQSGITVIKSLRLSIDSVTNIFFREKLELVYEKVLDGMKVSKALDESKFFTNMVVQMLTTGEESSALGDVCVKVSDHLDQEIDVLVHRLISLIGPISLVIIGVFVAFISMSFLLPLFRMTAVIHA
ncbi:MAG: type II secretion system F family protein [Candidatus Margulisbacteria bacterium]|nr:type II secretion system F family protein [Candidatus Margulisiibacteriota bacterium]